MKKLALRVYLKHKFLLRMYSFPLKAITLILSVEIFILNVSAISCNWYMERCKSSSELAKSIRSSHTII
jgi:hypothetical protein